MDLEKELFKSDISYLEGDDALPFDVYLKLTDRFIKVLNANQPPQGNIWQKIRDKKIDSVYICASDSLLFAEHGLKKIYSSSSNGQRASYLIAALNAVFENLRSVGVTKRNLSSLNSVSREVASHVQENKSLKFILPLIGKHEKLLQFSLTRTILALNTYMNLDFNSKQTMTKLAMASLLADIGIGENYPVLLKRHEIMGDNEKIIFNNHIHDSVNLLNRIQEMPEEVNLSILHHHENYNGTGPLELRKLKIYPLGLILSVSDELARMITTKDPNFRENIFQLVNSNDYPENISSAAIKSLKS